MPCPFPKCLAWNAWNAWKKQLTSRVAACRPADNNYYFNLERLWDLVTEPDSTVSAEMDKLTELGEDYQPPIKSWIKKLLAKEMVGGCIIDWWLVAADVDVDADA